MSQRVGTGGVLDSGAETVTIGIVQGDGPRWQVLKRIRPIGAVVRGIEDAVAVGVPGTRGAGQREEGAELRNVEDVHVAVRRVGGDVLPDGGRRNGNAEVSGHLSNVKDVRERIVVQVRRPRVVAAVDEWVGNHPVFDGGAESVAVRVARGDGPWR